MRTPNEQLDGHDADLSAADNLIESLRQQLADSKKREVMLRDRLLAITQCAPAEVECHNMHHKKQDQHGYDETCHVVVRYATALYDAQEALAATEPKK